MIYSPRHEIRNVHNKLEIRLGRSVHNNRGKKFIPLILSLSKLWKEFKGVVERYLFFSSSLIRTDVFVPSQNLFPLQLVPDSSTHLPAHTTEYGH